MLSIVMFETELFSCSAKQVIYTVVSSRLRSRLGRSQQFSPSPRGRDQVVSDRLTEFVNVASVYSNVQKKKRRQRNPLLQAPISFWEVNQGGFICSIRAFQKFRDPFYLHRFPRGTRMGCAINRLSDTWNFYFKGAEASTIKEEGIAETIQFCESFYVELRFRKSVKTCLFLENRCFALNVYTTD